MFLVLANLNAGSVLIYIVGVNASQTFGDDHRGVDIAVCTLGQCHLLDELVHQCV